MAVYWFISIVFVLQIITAIKANGEEVGSVSAGAEKLQVLAEDNGGTKDIRQKRSDDSGPLEAVVMQQAQELATLKATIQAMSAKLDRTGSTFVRWGKPQCPDGTTTVYTGYAGSGYTGDTGAGANRICLTSRPVYDDMVIISGGHGTVYGAQYYFRGHTSRTDVLCSLCHTSFSATFMVPGTNSCPNGTTKQYQGYLTVGDHGHAAASEFVCVDENPEDRPGSTANEKCAWFDHTATVCGTLPCPPYVSGKPVTCVVCSQ